MGLKVTFDLSTILASSGNFSQSQRRALTPAINRVALKQEFGQRAIETILDRTNEGNDVNGVPFEEYSRAYKKSRAFTVFGKSTRTVNLKLSGQMQAAINIIPSTGPKVTIGFPDGLQSKKARRHNFGLKKMPRRFFFDLTTTEQSNILKGLFRDFNSLEQIQEINEIVEGSVGGGIDATTIIGDEAVQETTVSPTVLSILGDLFGRNSDG